MSINFKNVLIYKLSRDVSFADLEEQMAQFAFTPCGSQDMAKTGWISPMGNESATLAHVANKQILITLQCEKKDLPAPVIARELASKVERLEQEQHRKLKKTEKDSLKDEVIQTLLPRAFSKYSTTSIWINAGAGLIIIDAASARKAENALALLRKTMGSLPVVPLTLETPIELTLTEWLRSGAAPAGFILQEEAELKAVLEQGGILRSKHQDLVSDEIRGHIAAGKLVTKLALEWQGRISFMLSDDGSLKRVKYSTTLLERNDDIDREDYAQRFDADFILMAGELAALIAHLVDALGGEATSSSWVDLDGVERDDDDRYPEAVNFTKAKGKASISGLQRELRIGYNRAAWLIERMQAEGIVSQPAPDGTREVLAGEGA
ncbi:recombination-associated protein rdgC [Yersinia pseudotuberculosis IP 32953]|uniref:Recombination-associated protein RdgC n=1 Tax=Yersinia pseudotuberculosis serotype I (strain IP32953) TaxID=273123 RepID=Q66BH6_YERPS|nr:recombination-associated protein rdgC [Yersinia pseudotuberculosis IP 32953]PSH43222.1 recombination-associated protein RdgC [Yersinia pseudotuberculosis]PSH45776.1 recombination-associated protein RdgC [Yersinia pseudotuberculosis]CAH21034.1 possible recombination associated protein RdgC [Yersinia pseudotuberculosis IP 32953]CND87051.1 recombination associated protein [Yersinia pseudotuberculosis]